MSSSLPDLLSCRSLLVLGGARSGKSRYAQRLAEESGLDKCLIATAEAGDAEMSDRIARHRADRGSDWTTCEEPLALTSALRRERRPGRIVTVDCLTLWLTNIMLAGAPLRERMDELARAVAEGPGPVILVSNEVGLGIAPATPLGREFRDWQGRLNQDLGTVCDVVLHVTSGFPQILKPAKSPVIRFI